MASGAPSFACRSSPNKEPSHAASQLPRPRGPERSLRSASASAATASGRPSPLPRSSATGTSSCSRCPAPTRRPARRRTCRATTSSGRRSRRRAIDAIVCLSVNDPFVMEAWGRDQEAANVFLLADGNGQFTEKMGLLVDKSDLNFGKRSWRYSMLVRNGRIEKQFIEPNEPGDPFKVSDADTMLAYINPAAKKPDQVAILTRDGCSFCARAKRALTEAGYDYVELPLPHTIRSRAIGAIAGARHRPAGLHQRSPDRRRRGSRRLPAARRVSRPRAATTGGCRCATGTRPSPAEGTTMKSALPSDPPRGRDRRRRHRRRHRRTRRLPRRQGRRQARADRRGRPLRHDLRARGLHAEQAADRARPRPRTRSSASPRSGWRSTAP